MSLEIVNWKDTTTHEEVRTRLTNLIGFETHGSSLRYLSSVLTKPIIKLLYGNLRKAELKDNRLFLDINHYPDIKYDYTNQSIAITVTDSNDVHHETSLNALMKYAAALNDDGSYIIKLHSIHKNRYQGSVYPIDRAYRLDYLAVLIMRRR